MQVIPGGLTPYLQAGDLGIFKEFKDFVSSRINSSPNRINSINVAGFSPDISEWHIAKHDVYGKLFYEKYLDRKLSDLAIEVFKKSDEFEIEDE